MNNLATIPNLSTGNIDLSNFYTKKMYCPVTKKMENVYSIPLHLIQEEIHNPGRINGTDNTNANQIFDDLITNPEGQEEPIVAKYNKSTGMLELVYGYTRLWAFRKAKQNGFVIANSSNHEIFVRIHTGTKVDEITQQMMENANKPPSKPATKDDMVFQLQRLIGAGGLDDSINNKSFNSMSDEEQSKAARNFLKEKIPLWAGRKFRGLWSAYCTNGQTASNNFKNWIKYDMSSYFINNNDEGITAEMVLEQVDRDYIKSGDIFVVHRKEQGPQTIAVYFATQSNAYNAGALLVNVSRKKFQKKPDRIVVVQAINSTTSSLILEQRNNRLEDLTAWHMNVKHVIDKIYWVPQSRSEISKYYNSGGWAKTNQF